MYFRIIFELFSPGKWHRPSYAEAHILFTQGCFVPSLVEIGSMVLEKMWKVYRWTDGRKDGRRTTVDQKSSPELKFKWANKILNNMFPVDVNLSTCLPILNSIWKKNLVFTKQIDFFPKDSIFFLTVLIVNCFPWKLLSIISYIVIFDSWPSVISLVYLKAVVIILYSQSTFVLVQISLLIS